MQENKRGNEFVEHRKSDHNDAAALIPKLPYTQRHARTFMTLTLMISDMISLLLAYGTAVWLRTCMVGDCTFMVFWNALPILALFLIVYALNGLYPGVGISPVQEMKQLLGATNIVFLLLIALTFWEQTSSNYSRLMLSAAWVMALALVQVNRWLARIIARNLGFWGEPVAVVGTGAEGQRIVKYLNERLRLGMRPVLTIDGRANYDETPIVAINQSCIRTIILVTPEMSAEMQKRIVDDQRYGYHRRHGEKPIPRLILISSLGWVGSLGIVPHDLDGILGLEVCQNLLNKWPNMIKRLVELVLTVIFGALFAPFFLLIMLLIRLDSPGGAFYRQERVGRCGIKFRMWKFRSMHRNADQVLADCLAQDERLKAEWDANQKLKDDPRITRVGRFLRKFSLDEIPQLINVINGEMSLVGPRPYFPAQEELYASSVQLYQRVRPGMTGMWQVRGRNMTSFKERARLDEYYIRNWSVWLDIYILLRTVLVVISREGAF